MEKTMLERLNTYFLKYGYIFVGVTILAAIVVVICLCVKLSSSGYAIFPLTRSIDIESTASVGSFMGGVIGPIVTLSTFFIMYLAFCSQHKLYTTQFSQITSLREGRDREQFRQVYFAFLNSHTELTNSLLIYVDTINQYSVYPEDLTDKEGVCRVTGRNVFYFLSKNLDKALKAQVSQRQIGLFALEKAKEIELVESLRRDIEFVKGVYNQQFVAEYIPVAHYYRNLYHLLKLLQEQMAKEIDEAARMGGVSAEDISKISTFYRGLANNIQSKMSAYELVMVAYNSLRYNKLRKLIIEFNLIENITPDMLLEEEHASFFPEIDFKMS